MGVIAASEKSVQYEVRKALQLHGYVVYDMSQPRRSMMPLGLPDLFAVNPRRGLQIWVEVKRPDGKLAPDQADWHRTVKAAGGRVYVVHSGAEMHDVIRGLHG